MPKRLPTPAVVWARDPMRALIRYARSLGYQVDPADTYDDERHIMGRCWYDRKLIEVERRLSSADAISTLAHEIGHAYLNETIGRDHTELDADRLACRILIDPDKFEKAAAGTDDPAAIAEALGVRVRLVKVQQAA